MMRIRTLLFSAAALLVSVSCLQEMNEGAAPALVGDRNVLTKVINTPAESVEGSLLVCLSETGAASLAEGDMNIVESIRENIQLVSFEPVFPEIMSDDPVARKHNLHRWYSARFEGMDNASAAAVIAENSAVSKVQYNKIMTPASDCRAIPYAPVMGQLASAALPFNDPFLGDQWHYINSGSSLVADTAVEGADIAVKDAWGLTAGDRKVIVAVIDGPVKYDHPDLAANMWKNEREIPANGVDDDKNGYVDDIYGWNCETNSGKIDWSSAGESGHGTHVAGTVAAVNGNGTGVCGVAGGTGKGDGVRLMSCQIMMNGISTNLESSAKAFVYAAKNGACVAQCSFGWLNTEFKSDADYKKTYGSKDGKNYSCEYDALMYFMDPANCNLKEAIDANIVIAAAGNDAVNVSSYPAALQEVVSVTALGPDYLPAVSYTNYGPGCNVAAPGGDYFIGALYEGQVNRSQVLSTFIKGVKGANTSTTVGATTKDAEYAFMQGTSMACPHVSGVAALGLSYALKIGKKFSREEFISMLLTSVNDIDSRMTSGKKVVGISGGTFQYFDFATGNKAYRKNMGTGAVDAWRFLMSIEGTPSVMVRSGESARYDITSYFGGSAANLEYLGVEIDEQSRKALGLSSDPEIKYGKLSINPTKVGSGKVTVRAIAGPDPDAVVDGDKATGGMEITRTISILSRGVASSNGGWL